MICTEKEARGNKFCRQIQTDRPGKALYCEGASCMAWVWTTADHTASGQGYCGYMLGMAGGLPYQAWRLAREAATDAGGLELAQTAAELAKAGGAVELCTGLANIYAKYGRHDIAQIWRDICHGFKLETRNTRTADKAGESARAVAYRAGYLAGEKDGAAVGRAFAGDNAASIAAARADAGKAARTAQQAAQSIKRLAGVTDPATWAGSIAAIATEAERAAGFATSAAVHLETVKAVNTGKAALARQEVLTAARLAKEATDAAAEAVQAGGAGLSEKAANYAKPAADLAGLAMQHAERAADMLAACVLTDPAAHTGPGYEAGGYRLA